MPRPPQKIINGCVLCPKCKEMKPLDDFNVSKRATTGRMSYCKLCSRKNRTEYYLNNREKCYEAAYRWRKRNLDKAAEIMRNYRKNNLEKQRQWARKNLKKRLGDPAFRATDRARTRLKEVMAGRKKHKCSMKLIGCTPEALRAHLESLWKEGMSWENYGLHGWHIDHIKPCSMFDLTDNAQVEECFHYTNLQPLWAFDNISKGGANRLK